MIIMQKLANKNLILEDMWSNSTSRLLKTLTFRKDEKKLNEQVKQQKNKRFVSWIISTFLFDNKKILNCLPVEGWCEQKLLIASCLCPYS